VSTPSAASPGIKGVPAPPPDLFDLVLVDEAHHSPAPTWNALIAAFPAAKVVLFTATPFRRDRKEIKARYVYTYPIQRAFEDGIYGEMTFVAVMPNSGQSADEALATKAEAVFREDQAEGFMHSMMVRVDSRMRAKELAAVYNTHTKLRLDVVDSAQSQQRAEKTVQRLRDGELDGVICVNMLGEGFDLPRLKLAALHSPHRSLGVTLQFFGRFARMNGAGLGEAKFLGVPSEMRGELSELFEESESWGRKIRLLGQEKIGEELAVREFLEEFEHEEPADTTGLPEDISLYSFTVFNHVKVHQIFGKVDLHAALGVPGLSTERVWVNEKDSTTVGIFREDVRPPWATTPGLDRVEHHLAVIYWDEKAGLLFICSSLREESLYKAICSNVVGGSFRTLSLNRTSRVLRAFSDLELFNVGIRNRATGTVAESYRQISGSSAHIALDKGDAALYHRGHIFGRGETANGITTIGVSSLGKIWRLEPTKIPDLVKWCKDMARDIDNPAPFKTGIAIDHFDVGVDITQLPDVPILAADWDEQLYSNPMKVMFSDTSGQQRSVSILDVELTPEPAGVDPLSIVVALDAEGFRTNMRITIGPIPGIAYSDVDQPALQVARGYSRKDLLEYISEEQVRFHLGDGSVLQGAELFPPMGEEELTFDMQAFAESVDWAGAGVDIEVEFGPAVPLMSLHEWLKARLLAGSAPIILYDHRPGECADLLVIDVDPQGKAVVDLYHCKASGSSVAGDRVSDLYEVCGQVIKATKFRNKRRLIQHIKRRLSDGSVLLRGTLAEALEILDPDGRYDFPLRMFLVQPGISRNFLSSKLASLLMTVNRGVISVGCQELRVICSA
jgi:hypothetical protein